VRGVPRSLRWFSLLFVAAIGVHQLRYLIGPGANAGHSFSAGAHAYLPLAAGFVALLFGASVVHFARTLALARNGEVTPPKPPRFGPIWLATTLALIAIFVAQESFEGALLTGHSSGLHGLFGHAGWTALFLAPALAALVALLMRGTQSIIAAAARAMRQRAPRAQRGHWPRLPRSDSPRTGVLASHLAGRAPPAFIS
jgi:hypothetical protein